MTDACPIYHTVEDAIHQVVEDASLVDLDRLIALAKQRKTDLKEQELKDLQQLALQVREGAKRLGVPLSSLFGDKVYRHPQDATLTWHGRGKKPNWLMELIAAGNTVEQYLVIDELAE